jgi:hypothetical protein
MALGVGRLRFLDRNNECQNEALEVWFGLLRKANPSGTAVFLMKERSKLIASLVYILGHRLRQVQWQ